MKKSVKYILIVLVVVAASGAFIAYKMWNKPHADAAEMPGIPVTAKVLVEAFETDEAAANTTYLSKVLEVSGTVSGVKTDDSLTFVSLTYADAMMGGVQVTVDPRSADEAKQLKEGEQATFKGFCNGYLMDVVIKDAVLIK
ncbi:MAG: hypothetical protein KDC13_07440 [Bacteroidetes bacterium]|nr:hypothetical protein [Bacteroidota bacterium]